MGGGARNSEYAIEFRVDYWVTLAMVRTPGWMLVVTLAIVSTPNPHGGDARNSDYTLTDADDDARNDECATLSPLVMLTAERTLAIVRTVDH